jgi:hypothetical protein
MKLEQYFDAYDNTHALAGTSPDWEATRRKVRWCLARPYLELTGRIIFLLGCLALGWSGHPIGFLLALGTLCFIPRYISDLREQTNSVRNLMDEEELQQLLHKEALKRMAGAVLGMFYYTAVALVFLATAAVNAWLGRDFVPGLVVGLMIAALGAYALLFRLPRAGRELTMLERSAEKSNRREESRDGN